MTVWYITVLMSESENILFYNQKIFNMKGNY